MTGDRLAWDEAYRRRRQLWGGNVSTLPDLPPAARVLELGCGNGKTFGALVLRGWDAVALDHAASAVTAARDLTPSTSGGHYVVADARAVPFRGGSFDAVFAWHILSHLTGPDREAGVREIVRLLIPGGRVFFSGFSRADFRYGSGSSVEEGTFCRGNSLCTHYFSEDEVRSLFGALSCTGLYDHRWFLRIRGREYPRSEIRAEFLKDAPP